MLRQCYICFLNGFDNRCLEASDGLEGLEDTNHVIISRCIGDHFVGTENDEQREFRELISFQVILEL